MEWFFILYFDFFCIDYEVCFFFNYWFYKFFNFFWKVLVVGVYEDYDVFCGVFYVFFYGIVFVVVFFKFEGFNLRIFFGKGEGRGISIIR